MSVGLFAFFFQNIQVDKICETCSSFFSRIYMEYKNKHHRNPRPERISHWVERWNKLRDKKFPKNDSAINHSTPKSHSANNLNPKETPSQYTILETSDRVPKANLKLGKERRARKLHYDEGYVTQEVLIESPDISKTVTVTVPKKESISPSKVLDQTVRDSFICAFCKRVPLNPFKLSPCDHWVCSLCIVAWEEKTNSKCPYPTCSFSILKVEVPTDRELLYLRCLTSHCDKCEGVFKIKDFKLHVRQCKGRAAYEKLSSSDLSRKKNRSRRTKEIAEELDKKLESKKIDPFDFIIDYSSHILRGSGPEGAKALRGLVEKLEAVQSGEAEGTKVSSSDALAVCIQGSLSARKYKKVSYAIKKNFFVKTREYNSSKCSIYFKFFKE